MSVAVKLLRLACHTSGESRLNTFVSRRWNQKRLRVNDVVSVFRQRDRAGCSQTPSLHDSRTSLPATAFFDLADSNGYGR